MMNIIQLQSQDQTKITKIFVFLILFIAMASTAHQIIRVIGASGIEWYSCESACVIIGIGNGQYYVAGPDAERIEDPTNNNANDGNGGNSGDSSGGSSGGSSGSGSGNGGGVYTFAPTGGGVGTACPGGTSMVCDGERCILLCQQE